MTSRRRFLAAAGGAALLGGCQLTPAPPVPADSPLRRGPFEVGRAILGVTPETEPFAVPRDIRFMPSALRCGNVVMGAEIPETIPSAVFYPAVTTSEDVGLRIRSRLAAGALPLVLFAHGRRIDPYCPAPAGLDPSTVDVRQDFLQWSLMCSHIASHGFVVVVPDLGWLLETFENVSWSGHPARATILAGLHAQLAARSPDWFADQLAYQHLTLLGHSTGGEACLLARQRLPDTKLLAFISPAASQTDLAAESPATLLIGGTSDQFQGANPQALYDAAPRPKSIVMLGGATHFGYSSLCSVDNRTCPGMAPSVPAAITRTVQAEAAAAFIVAGAKRFAKNDSTAQDFLDGTRQTGVESYLPTLSITPDFG